jgi:hypothetical protein
MKKTETQAVSQQQAVNQPRLPEFNEVIKIEVEVDAIYHKLMSEFPEDYKHKEIVAHAIIGSANDRGGLGFIYNALNGYSNDIDFQEGDIVICTEDDRIERYDANKEDENGEPIKVVSVEEDNNEPRWKYRSVPIGLCRVNKVNMYGVKKLTVEAMGYSAKYDASHNKYALQHYLVDHKTCTKTGSLEPEAVNVHK